MLSPNQSNMSYNKVEKAYAKLHGSYEKIVSGNCREALFALTGAPTKTIFIKDTDDKYEKELLP